MESEEDNLNIGSISFKDGKGHIVVDHNGNTEIFDLNFIVKNMKKSVNGVKGYYADKIREMSKELSDKGSNAIPEVQKKLEIYRVDKKIREFCKQWLIWLNYVNMFKNIKTNKQSDLK